jgi:poly-gamma-glutamate synthesis protein (capsule biosynthesis protein)
VPRRLLLVLLVLLALGWDASDGGEPSSTPGGGSPAAPRETAVALDIRVGGPLAGAVRREAEAAAAALGLRLREGVGGVDRLTASDAPLAAGQAVPVRYWAVFASFWSAADDLPFGAILRLARGEAVDWREFGGPAGPAELLVPEDEEAALARLLGTAPAATRLPLSALIFPPERALLLLPVEAAAPNLRPLAVEGVDLVRDGADAGAWPLAERLWLRGDGPAGEALADALAARLAAEPSWPLRLAFTGDIIPARCVYARQRARDDYASAFRGTAEFLREADLAAGSLDASISDAGEPIACERTLSLLAPSRSVEGLAFAGFDVITVATNHAKDCGGAGFCGDRPLLDSLANLRAAGIATVGGGRTRSEAHAPAVLAAGGVRFAFLGYDDVARGLGAGESTPGTAVLDAPSLREDIAVARSRADVVIVLAQWGVEYESLPTERQVELARLAVDAGAALVVGNHPHVVQAVEWRGGAFIAYALGNFVFDQDWSLETQQGMVLEATFHGARLVAVRLLPVRIVDMHRPTWAEQGESASILRRVREASEAIGVR